MEARSLLQGWRDKLATEGATSAEVKKIIQKMELYKQRLEDEVKSMETAEKTNPKEIVDRVYLIAELDSQIEWEKHFLEECKKAHEEEKFNMEIPNPLSSLSHWQMKK